MNIEQFIDRWLHILGVVIKTKNRTLYESVWSGGKGKKELIKIKENILKQYN